MTLPNPLPGTANGVPNVKSPAIKPDSTTRPPKLQMLYEATKKMAILKKRMLRSQTHADRLVEKTEAAAEAKHHAEVKNAAAAETTSATKAD